MRSSLDRTIHTRTRRVDTNARHYYHIVVPIESGGNYTEMKELTLKEANDRAWDIAQHYKTPFFKVTITRA